MMMSMVAVDYYSYVYLLVLVVLMGEVVVYLEGQLLVGLAGQSARCCLLVLLDWIALILMGAQFIIISYYFYIIILS
jgi:hypothetical protein